MKITKGLRSLNWDFWKSFPDDPVTHLALAWAVVGIFFAEVIYVILTPREVREAREEANRKD